MPPFEPPQPQQGPNESNAPNASNEPNATNIAANTLNERDARNATNMALNTLNEQDALNLANATNMVPVNYLDDEMLLVPDQNVPPAIVPPANATPIPNENRTHPQQTSTDVVQPNAMTLSPIQGPVDQQPAGQVVPTARNDQQGESVLVNGENAMQTTTDRSRRPVALGKAIKRLGRNRKGAQTRQVKVCNIQNIRTILLARI